MGKPTIINRLHLLHLRLVPLEHVLQRIAHFPDHALTRGLELGQLVRLLHQRIEGADLELRDGERGDGGVRGDGNGGGDGVEGVVAVVGGRDGGGEGEEDVFRVLGHGDNNNRRRGI